MRELVITIDGPAGAGKSTAARELARRLGLRLVDTGAMYRALAWAVRRAGLPVEDTPALRALIERTAVTLTEDRVLVDDRDVTAEIRTPEISELTSPLSALKPVRDKATPLQRAMAARGGAVLEGRDTGSVVYPEADVKFYLDAGLEARARRRHAELRARGLTVDLAAVLDEVTRRDRQDMHRALAPTVKPPGAIVIDSSDLSSDEVVERLVQEVKRVGAATERGQCSTRS